ncbi:MAG: hypothetical protein HYY93_08315 [Planctomycetes bacterium]|nr:hypothetical protein [Planctomycetota bacterium]
MEHPASRVTWDALEEAVSPDALPLRKGPSLEAVLPLINQVIGQVKAFGSDVEISVDPESPTSIAKRGGPERIIGLLLRFHLVAQQLRRRHDARATLDIKDEYDAQDLLHSLLRLFFDDIRAEECTPSYAGGSSRMDFLIKAEKTVVEVKMTRESLTERQVGTELIQDSARYSGHEDCRTLICFVYDPQGRIGNPEGLEKDLSRDEGNLKVRVLVVPRET